MLIKTKKHLNQNTLIALEILVKINCIIQLLPNFFLIVIIRLQRDNLYLKLFSNLPAMDNNWSFVFQFKIRFINEFTQFCHASSGVWNIMIWPSNVMKLNHVSLLLKKPKCYS